MSTAKQIREACDAALQISQENFSIEKVFLEFDNDAGWGWRVTVDGETAEAIQIQTAVNDIANRTAWKKRTKTIFISN